jgi:uncharacterized protein RhaS with RHS repeats
MLLGHRYYDPSTGRFLTRDPIKDGRNWYSYGGGDGAPTGFVDPDGCETLEIVGGIGGCVIGSIVGGGVAGAVGGPLGIVAGATVGLVIGITCITIGIVLDGYIEGRSLGYISDEAGDMGREELKKGWLPFPKLIKMKDNETIGEILNSALKSKVKEAVEKAEEKPEALR